MIVVLVGGPADMKVYELPQDQRHLVVPAPVDNPVFTPEQPFEAEYVAYETVTYERRTVVDDAGKPIRRLFFCCEPEDISPVMIERGLKRLAGAMLEKMT